MDEAEVRRLLPYLVAELGDDRVAVVDVPWGGRSWSVTYRTAASQTRPTSIRRSRSPSSGASWAGMRWPSSPSSSRRSRPARGGPTSGTAPRRAVHDQARVLGRGRRWLKLRVQSDAQMIAAI